MKKNLSTMMVTMISLTLAGCAGQNSTQGTSAAVVPIETTQAVTETAVTSAALETTSVRMTTMAPTDVPAAAVAAPSATAAEDSISESQALELAYKHAKVKAEEVQFHQVKLNLDDGVQEYDVKFYTQGKEYDYDIAAATGEIRSFDYEVEDHIWDGAEKGTAAGAVTEADAGKKALERVPGADESNLQIHMDMDDGKNVYEGKIIYNSMEYEFEIDASTGTFREWDSESVFD